MCQFKVPLQLQRSTWLYVWQIRNYTAGEVIIIQTGQFPPNYTTVYW